MHSAPFPTTPPGGARPRQLPAAPRADPGPKLERTRLGRWSHLRLPGRRRRRRGSRWLFASRRRLAWSSCRRRESFSFFAWIFPRLRPSLAQLHRRVQQPFLPPVGRKAHLLLRGYLSLGEMSTLFPHATVSLRRRSCCQRCHRCLPRWSAVLPLESSPPLVLDDQPDPCFGSRTRVMKED